MQHTLIAKVENKPIKNSMDVSNALMNAEIELKRAEDLKKKSISNEKDENESQSILKVKDLAVVCCYFNPLHYKTRFENYKIFRKNIEKTKVRFLTIELAFGNDSFELNDFKDVIQLRTKDVLWHKERLLNIGISKLIEEGYEKE